MQIRSSFRTSSYIRLICLVLTLAPAYGLVAPGAAAAPPLQAGPRTWITTGGPSVPRAHHSATLLANGEVLVAGGSTTDPKILKSAELYDPAIGTWREVGHMVERRMNHQAVPLGNGKVLVVGGNRGRRFSAEVYDPSREKWKRVRTRFDRGEIDSLKIVSLGEDRVLVLAGNGSASILETESGLARPVAAMPDDKALNFSAAALSDGRVLVVGGWHFSDNFSISTAEIYDPTTDTWTRTADVPYFCANYMMVLLKDGRVLAAGGISHQKDYNSLNRSGWIYDPASESWEDASLYFLVYPEGASDPDSQLTLLDDGSVLLTQPVGYSTCPSPALLNPTTREWEPTTRPNPCNVSGTATRLRDGRVLVVGGVDRTGTPSASAELFVP